MSEDIKRLKSDVEDKAAEVELAIALAFAWVRDVASLDEAAECEAYIRRNLVVRNEPLERLRAEPQS